MKTTFIATLFIFTLRLFAQTNNYDLVIVGGNPGGITAAIAAAREGKTSVILERTKYLGGLPANGLGATDLETKGATTGLFSDFVGINHQYYIQKYGKDSYQEKISIRGYHFEPSVATLTFKQMIAPYPQITILTMRQFDAMPINVKQKNGKIESIKILNRETNETEEYFGKIFIDATYEGDLAAAAGVQYFVGRESKAEYNEPGAGVTYKYWGGPEGDGTTGLGDNAVQAYNYRLCLSNDSTNRVPIKKPSNYNRTAYVSLIEDVWTGRYTGFNATKITPEEIKENENRKKNGQCEVLPGTPWGIRRIVNPVELPNKKTDANNQHLAFISTDLPEENWPWPTSNWEWRDNFAQRLQEYILGLIWFAQNDTALPLDFRQECLNWGLAKDEYTDNGNFPRQVYVREGRRIAGEYFFTAKDALPTCRDCRPPVHTNSITASHYALDSHATRKREKNRVHTEGFISYKTMPYTVPYGVIVPKGKNNLLCPVPVSGSHIGFSTLRMEPCWMALGEAAGIAATIAIDQNIATKDVNIDTLQDKLIKNGATLIYLKDIKPSDKNFEMIQKLALKGFFNTEWDAKLDAPIDIVTAQDWLKLANLKKIKYTVGKTTRLEFLTQIYNSLNKQ